MKRHVDNCQRSLACCSELHNVSCIFTTSSENVNYFQLCTHWQSMRWLTGCPSFGICTTACFEGVTLICLSHNFNLSRFAIAEKQRSVNFHVNQTGTGMCDLVTEHRIDDQHQQRHTNHPSSLCTKFYCCSAIRVPWKEIRDIGREEDGG